MANRGNTFVSLRGVLEILSKTELSSDIVDNFQDEVFGNLLPSLALTGRAKRWIEETEDVARGLGFTNVATSGNECVRRYRVEQYLADLSFHTCVDAETCIIRSSLLGLKALSRHRDAVDERA